MKYLNDRLIPYLMINPVRLVKGKETFSSSKELLKRTMWFKSRCNNLDIWRILSCTQIENDGRVLFIDQKHEQFPEIKLYLSIAQIKARGFIYVGE